VAADHPEDRVDDVGDGTSETQAVRVPPQVPRQVRRQPLHYDVRRPVHGEVGDVDSPKGFAQDEVGPTDAPRDDFGHVQRDRFFGTEGVLGVDKVPQDHPDEPERTEPIETRLPREVGAENRGDGLADRTRSQQVAESSRALLHGNAMREQVENRGKT
jgi:hypothetical protein